MKWITLTIIFILSGCVSVGMGDGGSSWEEEVLLHDGQKIILKRSVKFGGRHEIGQKPGYIEQTLIFNLPKNNQLIRWIDKSSTEFGNSDFLPMLLDVVNDTPYLVTYPMGCLSYNKWGRPNPPYVIFKYVFDTWQIINLDDLPIELVTPNLLFSDPAAEVERIGHKLITASMIRKVTSNVKQSEFKSILKHGDVKYDSECIEMVSNGRGLWLAAARFRNQPDLKACQELCWSVKFDDQHCPCKSLFERN